ncbi:MAG: hypothetical protein ACYS7Y_20220 [Planctomycetota bacterium]|jgi:hypothetical protein
MNSQVDTRAVQAYLRLLMKERGVKQLVLVDDGPNRGLMVCENRKDFVPSRKNAIRELPIEVEDIR